MRSILRLTALTLLIWSVAVLSGAAESLDDRPEVISEYAKGKRLLREGNYLEASRLFVQLAGRFPDSPNIDLFLFNRAKADLYFGSHSEALAGFQNFVRRFPQSDYLAHAYFFQGNIYYLKGQLDRAIANYVRSYRYSIDRRLSDMVVTSLVETVSGAKSVQLGEMDFAELDDVKRCQLIEPVAEALMARKNYRVAGDLAAMCGRELSVPGGETVGTIGSDLELALLLPFSGELQSFGEDIYHGAIIAAEQYRAESGRKIKLVPYDTKGDPIDAGRIVKELVNSNTDAVIGPLTSDEAAVTSAVLNCGYLPTIAPAATQAGLTMLSESTFQLSPNIELQGVKAAEYAIINRQADSAAIITPTSSDHLRMARAFADRFEQMGGTVVAIEYYRPRDKDFGQYVRDIKAALLGLHPDSLFFVNEDGDTLDAEAIPVGIDCLYLPGVASQLRLLLPQINFYSVDAFYIGSDGWGDDAVYRLGDHITRQAVFPSPFLEQERSQEYVGFAAEYDRRYGDQPHRLATLGYDAVKLIGMAVSSGAGSRQELVSYLGRIGNYAGAAAPVTFGEHRENIELPMYQLIDGIPVYLGEARSAASESGE
jgi:ABC-type branched-subunit amino acid transport system substrate-binding protein